MTKKFVCVVLTFRTSALSTAGFLSQFMLSLRCKSAHLCMQVSERNFFCFYLQHCSVRITPHSPEYMYNDNVFWGVRSHLMKLVSVRGSTVVEREKDLGKGHVLFSIQNKTNECYKNKLSCKLINYNLRTFLSTICMPLECRWTDINHISYEFMNN